MINKDKIIENYNALGNRPVVIDNTDKRSAVRKLLNGLGFVTADYINLPMSKLQDIYNGLLSSQGGPLMAIGNCTVEKRSTAVYEFIAATRHGTADELPIVPYPAYPDAAIKSETKQKEIPEMSPSMTEDQAIQALRTLLGKSPAQVDESRVLELIKSEVAKIEKPLPTQIEIKSGEDVKIIETGLFHSLLPNLVKALATKCNIMLVGPAGSGKTTLAHQAADSLGVQFYFNGAISSEYKLTGFVDAQGRIVSTAFRKAYENGGLYLFDEIDASMPDALLAFNAALANGHMDFPDGTVKRHSDFYCVAAANTFGKGADRVYVGRNQLDAASLDRFIVFNVDYDERLEKALAGNDNWTDKIQSIRKAVYEHKIRHVVSPRASIFGAKMLLAGFKESEVMDSVVWKGLDIDSVKKVKASI